MWTSCTVYKELAWRKECMSHHPECGLWTVGPEEKVHSGLSWNGWLAVSGNSALPILLPPKPLEEKQGNKAGSEGINQTEWLWLSHCSPAYALLPSQPLCLRAGAPPFLNWPVGNKDLSLDCLFLRPTPKKRAAHSILTQLPYHIKKPKI